MDAALAFAALVLHVDHVVTIRACRRVARMCAPFNRSGGEVLMWRRDANIGPDVKRVSENIDLGDVSPARALAHALEEVDGGNAPWTEPCVVQFLVVGVDATEAVISAAPRLPLFAGVGATHILNREPDEDPAQDVAQSERSFGVAPCPQSRLTGIQICPPTIVRRTHPPEVAGKPPDPQTREWECTPTRIAPINNMFSQARNIKFGNDLCSTCVI